MKNLITCLTVTLLSSAVLADTIHVPKQYPTIQVAINASMDGDEILVAPGTYNEDIDYNGRAVSIIGTGGSTVTTIVGQGANYPVTINNVSAGECSLSGFTVTAIEGWTSYLVYCNNATFSIDSCKLYSDQTSSNGIRFSSSIASVANCDFEIYATAIYIYSSDTVTTTNSVFHSTNNNGNPLILIGSNNTPSLFSHCTFENINSYRIFTNTSNSQSSIDQCVFRNNTTSSSCLFLEDYDTVSNCTFENNISGEGVIYSTPLSIDNCTFANNQSSVAAVYLTGTNTTISNTTFCENTLTDVVGNWINGGGNEFLADCGDVSGACCLDDSCYEVEQLFCESVSGTWLGFNVTCVEDTCAPPPLFGACCINNEAISLYDYDCIRILGAFMGEGTNPEDVTCPTICTEDVTGDGVVDVSDLLAIIAVWGACP